MGEFKLKNTCEAYCIVIKDHSISEEGFRTVQSSSKSVNNEFTISRFNAITPETCDQTLQETGLKWNYPLKGSVVDEKTKLLKSSYGERVLARRISCSLSHFLLWKKCADEDQPLLVLEHDVLFLKKLETDYILQSEFEVVGINSPFNATRRAEMFNQKVAEAREQIISVPHIDRAEVPQGLAGNSAYIIRPKGAKALVRSCYEYGLWPNDAIMCRQLFDFLGVTKTYYTTVQNLKSTTSL